MDTSTKPAAPTPAQREPNTASAPHSPMKRASEAQLASRRLIGRPQGPSSKLSQSISASDIAHRPSSMVVAPPKRMPGDNPNKRRPPASTVSHAPSNVIPKSTSFSGVSSTPRNIFRSSALYSRPGHQTFSPRVPANTLNQSFPPTTPGKPPRGPTPDVNGRILANTTSTELFKMRIPSPPRHLTGEMMAKEVPDDPNRSGSIYADEFLAHYCPPDLDEHQRRQFFCILDLRRLKYAADEVFTKKDWKINILNFAKEYEKSRSLIMLRYGLYEFKTVRASEAVKKEWKQKHGIPDSDDESSVAPKVNGTSKRKAEEELTPDSNTLTASISGANKRARAPESPVKNKRKADVEPDENQPAKLQKPAPPSATKSVFESIANKDQSVSATPAKSTGKSLFASSVTSKPNGSLGSSIFGTTPKPTSAASGNIFGHLSDGSKGSGNEGADEDSETGSEAEEEGSEVQDISQSDEPAASGGVETPQFSETKKPITNGTSSASSDAGEGSQGRSIFDRITKDSAGQPVRKLSPGDGNLFAVPADKERSASPVKEQLAVAPSNNTWNAGTPIKFAPTAAPTFGSTTQKPTASSTIDFGAAAAKKPEVTPAEAPKQATAQNIFGGQTKKKADDGAAPSATANGTTPGLFSGAKSTETPAAAPPTFGGFKALTNTGSSLFGSTAPAPDQQKEKEGKEEKPTTAAPSLFGAQSATAAEPPKSNNLFQSSNLFGNQNKTEAPATQPQFGGLFGQTQAAETKTETPASSLFSGGATKSTGNLFGANTASNTTSAEEPAAKKFAFGSTDTKSGSSLFGSAASTPAPQPTESKSLFGASSTPAQPATETKSLFGSMPAAPATQGTSLFGASAPAPAQEAKPLFGNNTEAKPLFGAATGATEAKPAGLFANAPASTPASSTPIFNFGSSQAPAASQSASSQPAGSIFGTGGSASFTFTPGGSDNTAIKNPFSSDGAFSAPSSFNFGSGGDAPSTSTSFTFGAGPTPTINFGGASDNGGQQSTSFGSTGSGSMFTFGGSSQPSGAPIFSQNPPAAQSIFGNSLAPGGGTSTGTNSPFTFGGASSLATTPAATTPEPSANAEDGQGTNADGDDAPQEQISLTGGGPGEEDESVVHEVRAKAVKLVTGSSDSDDDSGSNKGGDKDKAAKKKSPWKVQGVGPLRLLKNKNTGAVRMLLRAEPRGHIALNKAILPDFNYKADTKYVKLTTATDDGKGLETWMLQVKTPAAAQELAEALEEHKKANKK
ncbi:hypothetical protein C7999DRAFT_13313 [Corynascus novoguineensis]|uniref:RanBD1 domain-containing protein n=1 Tax=Corynascus novoguineensis TaxID=1126955 RepID=A0AAN7CUU8_9PEZI|nr:hypothetical protein C7999DRAFT_13313 [Corynascus novoguineensis]